MTSIQPASRQGFGRGLDFYTLNGRRTADPLERYRRPNCQTSKICSRGSRGRGWVGVGIRRWGLWDVGRGSGRDLPLSLDGGRRGVFRVTSLTPDRRLDFFAVVLDADAPAVVSYLRPHSFAQWTHAAEM
jgi:hypothetical protein